MTRFLVRIILRIVVLAAIIGLVAALVPGLRVVGGPWWLIWIAIVYSLVNLFIGWILRLLTLPLILVTLGLFLLVINAALLYLTAFLTEHLQIDGIWSAVAAAFLISLFGCVAELILPLRRHRRAR